MSASIVRAKRRTISGSTPLGCDPSRFTHGSLSLTPTRIVPPSTRSSVSSTSRGYWQPATAVTPRRRTQQSVRIKRLIAIRSAVESTQAPPGDVYNGAVGRGGRRSCMLAAVAVLSAGLAVGGAGAPAQDSPGTTIYWDRYGVPHIES